VAQRKKFLLRISPTLWEELNRWATQDFRSVNGQIEFLLQRAVDQRRKRQPKPKSSEEERRQAQRGSETSNKIPE
jgi:hypothetical protein